MNNSHAWVLIAVIALVTALLRFLPFIVFNGKIKTPRIIEKLGKVLPYAIMGMLVVYCLKDMNFTTLVSVIRCLFLLSTCLVSAICLTR